MLLQHPSVTITLHTISTTAAVLAVALYRDSGNDFESVPTGDHKLPRPRSGVHSVSMTRYWPLEHLRLRTPDLELSLPSTAELHQLAELAAEGIHPENYMPFGQPWSAGSPEQRARSVLQWHWHALSEIDSQRWTLPFVVLHHGSVVGTQDISGKDFSIGRQVSTGSWLGQRFQGQGIGTAMRAAVLEFAFRGLGATTASTSAFNDNAASQRVSEKLGYLDNGNQIHVVADQRRQERCFQLQRERWNCPIEVHIDELQPCLALLGAQHCSLENTS